MRKYYSDDSALNIFSNRISSSVVRLAVNSFIAAASIGGNIDLKPTVLATNDQALALKSIHHSRHRRAMDRQVSAQRDCGVISSTNNPQHFELRRCYAERQSRSQRASLAISASVNKALLF
jgi:hypothetical protein